MYIKRTAERPLKHMLDGRKIGIVLGARQVGKTTLVEHVLAGRNALFLNFDVEIDKRRFLAAAALAPVDGLKSLTEVLLDGVEKELITAYDARNDDDFKTPMTMAEVKTAFGAETRTREVTNFDTGEKEMRTIEGEIRMEEVKQFMIKEEWYFDKQNSRLQVRVVGICPIQEFYREGDDSRQVQRRKVFWIYYPEARDILAKSPVFNFANDARRMSFDDLFIRRYFNSYIVQESNVYNNRAINQYLSGKNAMLESKRIEDKIFNFEQDLWEY